jgi:hypothetical protein
MSSFMSLQWTGRARVVLVTALLAPPVLMPVLILVGVELKGLESVSIIWGFLMLAAVLAAYALFAVAKLLSWARQGLSERECASLAEAGRWSFRAMLVLIGAATLVIFRYEVIPMPRSTDYFMKYDRWTRDVTVEVVFQKPSGHVSPEFR